MIVRSADIKDIAALANLCRQCFPKSARWQGPRFLVRRWWRTVLLSEASETFIAEVDGQFSGFCLLVTDELSWAGDRRRRDGGPLCQLARAIWSPHQLLAIGIRRFRRPQPRHSEPARPMEDHNFDRSSRTWIELIAVDDQVRGRGVGKRLLAKAEDRTREIGRDEIRLNVAVDNAVAIALYARTGYRAIAGDRRLVYAKQLSRSFTAPPLNADSHK